MNRLIVTILNNSLVFKDIFEKRILKIYRTVVFCVQKLGTFIFVVDYTFTRKKI